MRRGRRLAVILAFAGILAAQPAVTLAEDGQVLNNGSNIAGNVFINGAGRAQVNFQNLNNCPGPVANTTCWAEIRFKWHCQEPWCFGWGQSNWYIVPTGQDWFADFGCQDGMNEWQVQVRLHFVHAAATTMEVCGDMEFVAGTYIMVPRYLWNVSLGAGFRGGALLKTVRAADAPSEPANLGASPGFIQGPSSC